MNGWTLYFLVVGITWTVNKVLNAIIWLDEH